MGLNDEDRKTWCFLNQYGTTTRKGDYNCLFDVTKEELLTFVEPAKELIEKITQLIRVE